MEDLKYAMEDVILETDIKKMLDIYIYDAVPEIHPSYFIASKGCFISSMDIIYMKILEIIKSHNMIIELLEMMPYIDNYIEMYF